MPFYRTILLSLAGCLFIQLGLNGQTICHPDGNVMIYSNYEGGTLTIDVDADIPNLKIGISTYEVVDVTITGAYLANVTEVIFAGFTEPSGITGVDPAIVTTYSSTADNIAICNYLSEYEIAGVPVANCMTGAEGCTDYATGGANSSPQIVQFFLSEFGPGSIFYAHWTDYSVFPGATFQVSEGGNCCFEDPLGDLNPIYMGGSDYDFLPDTLMLCDDDIILDISFYPTLWGSPEWNTGDLGYSITVDEAGIYSFTMADYCHYDPGSYLLTDTVVILECYTTIDTFICEGDSYILPGGTIVTDAGTYEDTLIAIDGSDSIVITNLIVNPVYDIFINDAICDGEIYILPDGSSTTTTGTYNFMFTTIYGCDSAVTLTLIVSESYAATEIISICDGETYTLPDGTNVSTTGIYISNLATVAGCDSIITTNLSVYPVYLFAIDTTICAGASVVMPDGSIVSLPGTYNFNNLTTWGCDSNYIVNLYQFPVTDINFLFPAIYCLESSPIVLEALPPGGVFSGDGVADDVFDPTAAGAGGPYTINYTVTDINGCVTSENMDVYVEQNYADAGNDTIIFDSGVAELNGDAGGDYNWFPPDALTCTACETAYSSTDLTITYILTSVDANGCVATDSITVTVLTSNETIYIPNTFTPNGDGMNDLFFINGPGVAVVNRFAIFDRWGEQVFLAENVLSDFAASWDGYYQGKRANEGVYAYFVEVEFLSGRRETFKGNVTLIR